MREHPVQRFLVHLGLELVTVLERGGLLRRRTGVDLVDQPLDVVVLIPGAVADHVGSMRAQPQTFMSTIV